MKKIISIIINSIILIPTIFIVINGILYGAGDGQLGQSMIGFGYFKAFTMNSNILASISSIFIIIFNIKSLILKRCYPHMGNYFASYGCFIIIT